MFKVPEQYRITPGKARLLNTGLDMASSSAIGDQGAFYIPASGRNRELWIIASNSGGWEHVSVHARAGKGSYVYAHMSAKERVKAQNDLNRTPNWDEMCMVKALFWGEEDCVVQYHPPKSQYVNAHPNTLHLWRPGRDLSIPTPPSWMVGPRADQTEAEASAEGERALSV